MGMVVGGLIITRKVNIIISIWGSDACTVSELDGFKPSDDI